ncbi:MAG: hypothetical protein SOT80_07300 [Candidatus Pseudoruminococcus sp.]|nr:hypothetical protein [Ruminococcus sp.]MDY2783193.1 hypothetical protein [Candidatus Pseudoruminococcus sp.]
MTEENRNTFRKNGIDIDTALARFAENDGLYLKYFHSFPDDRTYKNFINSFKADKLWQSQNMLITFIAIVGNLGFNDLYNDSRDLLRKVKSNSVSDAIIAIEKLKQDYSNIINFIKSCDI